MTATVSNKEAKKRARAIDRRVAPINKERDRIDKERDKAVTAWAKKWKKDIKEVKEERLELRKVCPHDFHYEMSFAQCQICGLSYNRSH